MPLIRALLIRVSQCDKINSIKWKSVTSLGNGGGAKLTMSSSNWQFLYYNTKILKERL